jgi:hypothetical protein
MIDFEKELSEARERVASMDKIDGHKDRDIATITAALEAGLRTDLSAAFDALVMLKDYEQY